MGRFELQFPRYPSIELDGCLLGSNRLPLYVMRFPANILLPPYFEPSTDRGGDSSLASSLPFRHSFGAQHQAACRLYANLQDKLGA
jgi:hypothetical protein